MGCTCGYHDAEKRRLDKPNIPDYCNDLNAMREAEKTLTDAEWDAYDDQLLALTPGSWNRHKSVIHPSPLTKAQAFLRVKGKWIESTSN